MSNMGDNLEKLLILEKEIQILEGKLSAKQAELEILTKYCDSIRNNTDKEIAQKKQQCEIECQEMINKTNLLLKDAEDKVNLANRREADSKAIEELEKDLEEKSKVFVEEKKRIDLLKSEYTEKSKKAELIIEQYTKKLEELNIKPEIQEESKDKKDKKKK